MKTKLFILIFLVSFVSFSAHAKKITRPTEKAVFHNNQGISYLNQNMLDKAEFEFKTAIELSSDYVEAYNNLGIIYKMKNQFGPAEDQFKKAISLDKG